MAFICLCLRWLWWLMCLLWIIQISEASRDHCNQDNQEIFASSLVLVFKHHFLQIVLCWYTVGYVKSHHYVSVEGVKEVVHVFQVLWTIIGGHCCAAENFGFANVQYRGHPLLCFSEWVDKGMGLCLWERVYGFISMVQLGCWGWGELGVLECGRRGLNLLLLKQLGGDEALYSIKYSQILKH